MVLDNTALKGSIMKDHNKTPEAGHKGQERTLELISYTYYWPGMKTKLNSFVAACDTCQRTKGTHTRVPPMLLEPAKVPF